MKVEIQFKKYKSFIGKPIQVVAWFATRCAIRSLPSLAYYGENFPYLQDEIENKISAIFLSVNLSIAYIGRNTEFDEAVPDDVGKFNLGMLASTLAEIGAGAAKSADLNEADAASAAIRAAINLARTVEVSALFENAVRTVGAPALFENAMDWPILHPCDVSERSSTYALARAAGFGFASGSQNESADIAASRAAKASKAAISADLSYIERNEFNSWPDLWHGNPPLVWKEQVKIFVSALNHVCLSYWAEEYTSWLEGRFNWQRIKRCMFMPASMIFAGYEAMSTYLLSSELVRAAEARVVFLGEGGAGKTSLIRLLFGENIKVNEPATPRVEIRKRRELVTGTDTLVYYWDFGGQVVMHATHQFFLREKSVYVIVLDIRRGDDLEYWLDHVRVFAAGAPTIIVLNKTDQLPPGMTIRPPFDLAAIRRRYPFVIDTVYPISCEKGEGIDAFGSALQERISTSQILNPDMPLKWYLVKEALALENRDFISRRRFDEICRDKALEGEETDTALKVLDILGVAIHFPRLIHHRDVVLNPEWITKAIYQIIWTSERDHFNGKLDAQVVKNIFDTAKVENRLDIEMPEDKYEFILDLMTEFKLAFKSGYKGEYSAPMLAQTEEPPHNVSREGGLRFVFFLPFLPPGLFYRFIAESGAELMDDLIWKAGAILSHGRNRVLVEYSEYQRTINFYAHGPKPGVYLTTLRQRLMQLMGESYKELDFDPYIIAPDGERISWRDMTKRYCMEGEMAKVYTEQSSYSIEELLKQFFGYFGNNLRDMLKTEFDFMRRDIMVEKIREGISIDFSPTMIQNNNPTMQNTTKVDVAVTVNVDMQNLMHFTGSLEMIKEAIDDFRSDEFDKAAEHEKELNRLYRDIERIITDVDKVKASDIMETEKKPLMGRIKERWDIFADRAKQCYYVTGLAEKIVKAGIWVAAIDWQKWLDKVPTG